MTDNFFFSVSMSHAIFETNFPPKLFIIWTSNLTGYPPLYLVALFLERIRMLWRIFFPFWFEWHSNEYYSFWLSHWKGTWNQVCMLILSQKFLQEKALYMQKEANVSANNGFLTVYLPLTFAWFGCWPILATWSSFLYAIFFFEINQPIRHSSWLGMREDPKELIFKNYGGCRNKAWLLKREEGVGGCGESMCCIDFVKWEESDCESRFHQ